MEWLGGREKEILGRRKKGGCKQREGGSWGNANSSFHVHTHSAKKD